MISDAGHGGLGVSGPRGGRPVRVCRPGPECVPGSAVDIDAPVDPGVLEHAAKRQDLIRGAQRVFGAGTQKERAGYAAPVLNADVWQAGMASGR